MAPMQTASEWLAENLCTDPEVDWLELNYEQAAELIAKIQLDVRIATLREAAKLMCPYCRMGDPFLYDETWCHKVVGHARALRPCMAEDMHDRVAELEAERGKEGEVT